MIPAWPSQVRARSDKHTQPCTRSRHCSTARHLAESHSHCWPVRVLGDHPAWFFQALPWTAAGTAALADRGPDAPLLCAASYDGCVCLWDLQQGCLAAR